MRSEKKYSKSNEKNSLAIISCEKKDIRRCAECHTCRDHDSKAVNMYYRLHNLSDDRERSCVHIEQRYDEND